MGARPVTRAECPSCAATACRAALLECRGRTVVGELVFLSPEGAPLSLSSVLRSFAIAKEMAEISRRLRIKDLRHTFASRVGSRGVPIQVISKALGHTSTRMTERYAKPSDESMNAIVDALSGSGMNSGMNSEPLAATGTAPGSEGNSTPVNELNGGRRGDRTPDHVRVKHALYH